MARSSKVEKNKTTKIIKTSGKGQEFNKYFSGKYLLILLFSTILFLLAILIFYIHRRINVALVNGSPISRAEYYKDLEDKNGSSVLDDLITKKIIFQEASKNNIVISESDISNELDNIKKSVEAQGSTLEEVLAYQGVTYNQLLENIKIQKILEVLLKDKISVSDEEVKAQYDQNKDVYGKDKTFDELKDDIKSQIFQQKITEAYRTWIENKKSTSIIEKYI